MTDIPDKEWIERATRAYHAVADARTKPAAIKALARELQSSFDQGVERERARCVAVADDYRKRMAVSASKPHPFTGKENTIAICKEDAAMSILGGIRDPSLDDGPAPISKTRRAVLPAGECITCDRTRHETMKPSHDASPRCESGKRAHCTCDVCF